MQNIKDSYINIEKTLKDLKQISHFYVCPGGRNKDIFAILKKINRKFTMCIDERSAAFMALGHAKYTKKPVAVVTTSGTAVGETLPATMEAFHNNIPLVVISFDRPLHLKNISAPQTTHQECALKEYVRSTNFNTNKFPKHINITANFEKCIGHITNSKEARPLLIHNGKNICNLDVKFLKALNCYLHFEVESEFYSKRTSFKNVILTDQRLDKLFSTGLISEIYSVGSTSNSSIWRKLERITRDSTVYSLKGTPQTLSCAKEITEAKLIQKLINYKLPIVCEIKSEIKLIEKMIQKFPDGEISHLYEYIKNNTSTKDILFIGNSTPIRNMKFVLNDTPHIFCNRGLNGIDGLMSTAIGIANATTKKVHCIIGDQSFIHDLNAIFSEIPLNLSVVILNNMGGQIFNSDLFVKEMINGHELSFSKCIKLPKSVSEIIIDNDITKKQLDYFNEHV